MLPVLPRCIYSGCKEGLIDTLHTMYTHGKIPKSEYKMWFHLNKKTKISILTPLGETDGATIMNGIGQGSFGAALASSLNIGCGIDRITKGICTARIGELELNSLIFQDDNREDELQHGGHQEGSQRCRQIVRVRTIADQHSKSSM